MRKQNFLLLVFSLFVIFVFTSCDLILLKTGKATISIENKIEDSSIYVEKTSKNATTVFIEEYIITANGPHGKKISKTVDANEATASFDSMLVGNWNIKVKAIADENIVVGEGSTSITIEENKENLVNIDIHEKEGKGKLVVSIGYNASTLTEIKVTPKESTANTVTEKLLKK